MKVPVIPRSVIRGPLLSEIGQISPRKIVFNGYSSSNLDSLSLSIASTRNASLRDSNLRRRNDWDSPEGVNLNYATSYTAAWIFIADQIDQVRGIEPAPRNRRIPSSRSRHYESRHWSVSIIHVVSFKRVVNYLSLLGSIADCAITEYSVSAA